jgi:general stress protein 26
MPAPFYNEIRKIGELIHDVRICMLTTLDETGHLHSRPMVTQQVEFDGDLWFFTSKSAHKSHELANDQRVNISFVNTDKQHFVSVSGIAELVDDRAKEKELWHDGYKAWFPQGLEDPDLVLLKVRVRKAEYWDSVNSSVNLLGYLAGRRPTAGEHQQVDFTKA